MSHSECLSKVRLGSVINEVSKSQENSLQSCVGTVVSKMIEKYGVCLKCEKRLLNSTLVESMNTNITNNNAHINSLSFATEHYDTHQKSFISPDGGFVYLVVNEKKYPVLISEVKHQGTNDKRCANGLKKQATGNAIERASKNIVATKYYMEDEDIFPYVLFAYGCDFDKSIPIYDRLTPNIRYGNLNTIYLYDDFVEYGSHKERVKRPSLFVRVEEWTNEEMCDILSIVMEEAIKYYDRKYDLGVVNAL